MILPIYHHINLKSYSLDDLTYFLNPNLNLNQPVSINLTLMNLDDQRDVIGIIENYYVSNNLSFKFPYPIYIVSGHDPSISKISLVGNLNQLPKFYSQRESRINVKESTLLSKNKLLQIEINNSDASTTEKDILYYAESHRIIFEQEKEKKFYSNILKRLVKAKKNG